MIEWKESYDLVGLLHRYTEHPFNEGEWIVVCEGGTVYGAECFVVESSVRIMKDDPHYLLGCY